MGRKGNFNEKQKKGPGRKAKKQQDPQLTSFIKGMEFYFLIHLIIMGYYNDTCTTR